MREREICAACAFSGTSSGTIRALVYFSPAFPKWMPVVPKFGTQNNWDLGIISGRGGSGEGEGD